MRVRLRTAYLHTELIECPHDACEVPDYDADVVARMAAMAVVESRAIIGRAECHVAGVGADVDPVISAVSGALPTAPAYAPAENLAIKSFRRCEIADNDLDMLYIRWRILQFLQVTPRGTNVPTIHHLRRPMKVSIVSGSHRPNSQSLKVARFVEHIVRERLPFEADHLLDLATAGLPFWTEDPENLGSAKRLAEWEPVSSALTAADAFVFVVPEWAGMAPPKLKNLLVLCDRHELAHKPALLIGVSSGLGGSLPLAEMRANSSKDTHICYIPEYVVIRNVLQFLNSPDPRSQVEIGIHRRISYCLDVLYAYSLGLKTIRDGNVIDLKTFPYGM